MQPNLPTIDVIEKNGQTRVDDKISITDFFAKLLKGTPEEGMLNLLN